MELHQAPSPNFNDRAVGSRLAYVVLHYTGMRDAASALARLCEPTAQVSAHYLIERDGKIWQLVPDTKRAWHAGVSSWLGETDMNSASLGIELVNRGHQLGYENFPPAQIKACITLLQSLLKQHNIPPHNILAHSDIAPQRKEDPGELFPWQELAQQGLGLWPTAIQNTAPLAPTAARQLLQQIGYDCAPSGDYDPALRNTLLAFQRHWLPHNLSGLADASTSAMLQAVLAARVKG